MKENKALAAVEKAIDKSFDASIKILEEIKADYIAKFENDPAVRRVCSTMINEYKIRIKQQLNK